MTAGGLQITDTETHTHTQPKLREHTHIHSQQLLHKLRQFA